MTTHRLLQLLLLILAVLNIATGLALILAPQWFFDHIGTYPPFNRHYEGDLGSFIVPIGIGLLWAARDPKKYRALIGIGFLASLFHTFNHVYDDLLLSSSFSQMMQGVIPVGFQTLLLALALYLAGVEKGTGG